MPPSTNRPGHKPGLGGGALLMLAALLILPGCVLVRFFDLRGAGYAAGWVLLISIGTYVAYAVDKRRAESQAWRIPEGSLHLMELLGGWPGAFLAQRILRHKTIKVSYQIVFILIILLHELAALDALRGWAWAGQVIPFLGRG